MLSFVNSIYDPLGFVGAVVLPGRRIIQTLCHGKFDLDEPISDGVRDKCQKWSSNLHLLKDLIQLLLSKLKSGELNEGRYDTDKTANSINVQMMQEDAQTAIIKFVQKRAFWKQIKLLSEGNGSNVTCKNPLYKWPEHRKVLNVYSKLVLLVGYDDDDDDDVRFPNEEPR